MSRRSDRPSVPPAAAPASGAARRRVLVGEFGRAQGLRGEVRLKSHTAEPTAIARFEALESEDGARRFRILSARPVAGTADMLVVRVAGVDDRTAAEALTRMRLYVPREALAAGALDEDEYLQADLVGLAVYNAAGERLGRILAFHDFGAGDVMEVAPEGGGATVMWPFTKAFVPEVDVAGGRVVVAAESLAGEEDEDEA